MTDPDFQHFDGAAIPAIEQSGLRVRAIAGSFDGVASPISTFQKLVYLDVLAEGAGEHELDVNPLDELAVYVCEGSITIGGTDLRRFDLGRLSAGDSFSFRAEKGTRFMLFGGEPLAEPTVIYWNFVTDTVGEAKQRLIDWGAGKFPPVKMYRKIAAIGDEGIGERILTM